MRILIATTPTASASAREYGEAVVDAWFAWNPADDLSLQLFPHEGRGILEPLVELGYVLTGPGHAVRENHHVIDVGTVLSDQDPDGSTAPLAEILGSALARGATRVSVATPPLTVHDGGRGLLERLAFRLGSVEEARAAFAGVRLELVTASPLPLLGLKGAGAALTGVIGAEEAQRRDTQVGEWAAGVERDHVATDLAAGRPLRLSTAPGSGLAGGAGFALLVLGAVSVPEAEWMAEIQNVVSTVASNDLVVAVVPILDGDSMDASALTAVSEPALENAVPVVVLTHEDQTSRRARAGLGIVSTYVVEGNNFGPANVGQLARRVAQTWSRPDIV